MKTEIVVYMMEHLKIRIDKLKQLHCPFQHITSIFIFNDYD